MKLYRCTAPCSRSLKTNEGCLHSEIAIEHAERKYGRNHCIWGRHVSWDLVDEDYNPDGKVG